jgi:hypothetical protein
MSLNLNDIVTDGTSKFKVVKSATDLDVTNEINNLKNQLGYRKPNTAYSVGNIAHHITLPIGYYLECTTAGMTSSSDLTINSPSIGGTVSDGTVVWTVNRDLPLIGGGALTGTNLTWNANDLGGSAIVAKSIGTNGYVKYASGLIVQWGVFTLQGSKLQDYAPMPVSMTVDSVVSSCRQTSTTFCYPLNNSSIVIGRSGSTTTDTTHYWMAFGH